MNHVATYHAVYRVGNNVPHALFLNEQDALEWHANPAVYSNCRRRVVISPTGKEASVSPEMEKETEAQRLLRIIVSPGDHHFCNEIEQAQELLGIKIK